MQPEAILIVKPDIDFGALLTIAHKALGFSPASAVDNTRRELNDAERYLSILAAIREQDAPVGLTPHLFGQLHYAVLVICGERELLEILEVASGMPFLSGETVTPGISLAVISGDLKQWRDTVKIGANVSSSPTIRICFSKILLQFDRAGLSQLWADCTRKEAPDHTGLYLEDKRR
jgi:hypothetical protein